MVRLARTPAEGASYFGVPNPIAALQRQFNRIEDPTRLYPRGDYEYYTLEDIEALDENGDPVHYVINDRGQKIPDEKAYFKVGQPKTERTDEFFRAYNDIIAMAVQGSAFENRQTLEKDLNTVGYDTLGNKIGYEDVSYAINPKLALWNNFTGIRIREGKMQNELELALGEFYQKTGVWPLRTKVSHNGLRLSKGARFDLVNLAKNVAKLNKYGGSNPMTFREALEYELTFPTSVYRQGIDSVDNALNDDDLLQIIRTIEDDYYEAGFQLLLQLPENADLATAYENRQEAKQIIDELGIIQQ